MATDGNMIEAKPPERAGEPAGSGAASIAPGDLRQVVDTLRRLIHQTVPDAREDGALTGGDEVTWTRKTCLCTLAQSKGSVVLGFSRGSELVDRHGLLEGEGPGLRRLTIRSPVELDEPALTDLVRQAAALAEH